MKLIRCGYKREESHILKKVYIGGNLIKLTKSVIVETVFREVDVFGLGYLISRDLRQKTCDKFNYILVCPYESFQSQRFRFGVITLVIMKEWEWMSPQRER